MDVSRIMVPVGGRSSDDETLALACFVAKRHKAALFAVYVIQMKHTVPLDADIPLESEEGERVLSHAERVAEELDYEMDTALLQAREVGPALVDEAVEREIDLIIMGVDYKTRFGEFSMGNVVPYVLRNAPCRVWLCRETPPGPDASEPSSEAR